MPRHVDTLKAVITMSQLRWTEFSLTICRGMKRRLRCKRRFGKDDWGEAKFTGSVCRGAIGCRGREHRSGRLLGRRSWGIKRNGASVRRCRPVGDARREVRFKL